MSIVIINRNLSSSIIELRQIIVMQRYLYQKKIKNSHA